MVEKLSIDTKMKLTFQKLSILFVDNFLHTCSISIIMLLIIMPLNILY